MAEYVQVPVSLPTREQIAAEVKRVTHVWSGPSMDEFINDPPTRKQYAIADAVLALLSQPTPTAEPCERCGGTGYQGDGPLTLGVPCPNCHAAEPPRIEDMAPGTTFTEEIRWTVTKTTRSGVLVAHADDGGIRFLDNFDPSTIRDVTPPKE